MQLQLVGRELRLTFDDSIRYQSKGAGLRARGISTRVLEFIEDAALGGKLACSELAIYARVACQQIGG